MTLTQRFLALGGLLTVLGTLPVAAQESKPLLTKEVEELHQMLRPQPGESRWMEIDWYPSVWEARQKAAAEGKPLFLLAGSGGAPPSGC
jgi:hypothetical protein